MENFDQFIEDVYTQKNSGVAHFLEGKYYTDFYHELMDLCDVQQPYIVCHGIRAEHKRALYEFQHHHCTKWVMKAECTKNLGLYVMGKV